jgi:uncharacterized protein YcsI (UPF0317 family)
MDWHVNVRDSHPKCSGKPLTMADTYAETMDMFHHSSFEQYVQELPEQIRHAVQLFWTLGVAPQTLEFTSQSSFWFILTLYVRGLTHL